jgi:hypothetical protein
LLSLRRSAAALLYAADARNRPHPDSDSACVDDRCRYGVASNPACPVLP